MSGIPGVGESPDGPREAFEAVEVFAVPDLRVAVDNSMVLLIQKRPPSVGTGKNGIVLLDEEGVSELVDDLTGLIDGRIPLNRRVVRQGLNYELHRELVQRSNVAVLQRSRFSADRAELVHLPDFTWPFLVKVLSGRKIDGAAPQEIARIDAVRVRRVPPGLLVESPEDPRSAILIEWDMFRDVLEMIFGKDLGWSVSKNWEAELQGIEPAWEVNLMVEQSRQSIELRQGKPGGPRGIVHLHRSALPKIAQLFRDEFFREWLIEEAPLQ